MLALATNAAKAPRTDTQRIVMQTAGGEDVRWADNIPLLVQARIVQAFENAKYLKVGTDAGDLEADCKLAIDIRKFRVTTSPVPPMAEVEMSAKLLDARRQGRRRPYLLRYRSSTVTDNPGVAAKALDSAFGAVATDLVVWTLNAESASATAAGAAAP